MKLSLTALLFIFYITAAHGQENRVLYHLSEVGLTIYLPIELQPTSVEIYYDKNSKPITDSAVIREITKDYPKTILSLETADHSNKVSISVTAIDKTFSSFFGDSAVYLQTSKKMVIAMARQATPNFDTLFTTAKIGNLLYNKLFAIATIGEHQFYQGGYLTKMGDKYVNISLFFDYTKYGKTLIEAIEGAKSE